MRNLIDFVLEKFYPTTSLYGMTNVRQARTGLPFIVFLSTCGRAKHDVRVKVSYQLNPNQSDFVIVGILPDVHFVHGILAKSDFDLLVRWIEINRDAIVTFWDSIDMDSQDILGMLKSI